MNKLEVGMYVRTKNKCFQYTQIAKITNMYKDSGYKNQYYIELDRNLIPDYNYHIYQEDVLKASYNIIDLIEEGDYVNGLRVEKSKYGELYTSYVYYGGDIGKQCEVYTTWLEEYKENEDLIETILTKEQYESVKYEVGNE